MEPYKTTFGKTAANLALAFLLGTVLAEPVAGNAADPQNSVYCREDLKAEGVNIANFANIHQKDGSLVFAANAISAEGSFSAYGRADKMGENHWQWVDTNVGQSCIMDIKYENDTWTLVADKTSNCNSRRGERAPGEIPTFSNKFLITSVPDNVINGPKEGSPGDNIQIMMRSSATCADYKKPYTQPYTTESLAP